MRVVSPPRGGGKRARQNDAEPARRVAQRAEHQEEANTDQTVAFLPSMVKIVKKLNETDNESILTSTMSELVRLLYRKDGDSRPKTQEAFFNSGGHLAVVTIMTKHPNAPFLQHEGIRALTNATCDNKKLKFVVAEIGGIQATCAAMTRHAHDRETQRLGLKALNNLIHKRDHARLLVNELDGCTTIVNAMNGFLNDVDVIQKACAVVLKLSWVSKKLTQRMLDANVVEALAAAREHHTNDEKIQNYARDAMVALNS